MGERNSSQEMRDREEEDGSVKISQEQMLRELEQQTGCHEGESETGKFLDKERSQGQRHARETANMRTCRRQRHC